MCHVRRNQKGEINILWFHGGTPYLILADQIKFLL